MESKKASVSKAKSFIGNMLVLGVPGPVEAIVNFPTIFIKNQQQTGGVLPPLFRANPKWDGKPSLLNLREYYRGCLVTAGGNFFAGFLQLAVNQQLKQGLGVIDKNGKTKPGKEALGFACSCLSGLAMAITVNPVELTQVTQGLGSSSQKRSLTQTASELYSKNGVRSFFTGFASTAARDMCYGGLIFGLYPYIDNFFRKQKFTAKIQDKYPMFMSAISGGVGGVVVGTLTVPIDNCRTLIQSTALNEKPLNFRGALKCVSNGEIFYNPEKQIFEKTKEIITPQGNPLTLTSKSGLSGVFRGGIMRIVRTASAGFVILFSREITRKLIFGKQYDDEE